MIAPSGVLVGPCDSDGCTVGTIVGRIGVALGGSTVGTVVGTDAAPASCVGVTYMTTGGCGEQAASKRKNTKKYQCRRVLFDFVIVSMVSQRLRAGYKKSLRIGAARGDTSW